MSDLWPDLRRPLFIRWRWLCRLARWAHFSPRETVVAVRGWNVFLVDGFYGSRQTVSPVWDRARLRWWLSRALGREHTA
jgi:hypothetical protein